MTNNCGYTVWPGLLSGAGTAPLSTTGFSLDKGQSKNIDVPTAWSGRMWGRTLCTTDSSTGKFTCGTADCDSNDIQCSGHGAAPPATLAEFTLNGYDGKDFYDVSLVDGYNLPMSVVPQGGGGNCSTTGCFVDLNGACPADIRVTVSNQVVACKSACDAFQKPEYCCTGEFGSPNTCKPTQYSQFFKNACPKSYSYAYDDGSSTFTCTSGAGYSITFCPDPSSQPAGDTPSPPAGGTPAPPAGNNPPSTAGQAPGVVPGQTPGVVPGQTPGVVPGQTPGVVPGQTPGIVSSSPPGDVSGSPPGYTPGQYPGSPPVIVLDGTPVYLPSMATLSCRLPLSMALVLASLLLLH